MSKQEGITVKKEENFSEWYTQVILKSELIDYSPVSGCYVIRPYGYAIWENIKQFFKKEIEKKGVKEVYFPLLIPEQLLKKEAAHIKGFSPEVAWVTETGNTKLNERLAIRPTSEAIEYDAFSKWIRSYKDLPLKLNQWCSVVRWEFKHPTPFLRSREFLWQEGHTAFATKEEADKEALDILNLYANVYENLAAIPIIKGRKSEKEKFSGADRTYSIETFFALEGKAIQGATSHNLGQNFSKVFNIKFLDKDEKEKYVWQNSWGFSTRTLGIAALMHGDDKGLILPPKIAPNKVVIIPIIFKNESKDVLKKAKEIEKKLKKFNVLLDDREEYTPGYKFNEWELKGIPIRIEIGPRDIQKNQVILVRRDTNKKQNVKMVRLIKTIETILEDIQNSLFKKAKYQFDKSIVNVKTWNEFMKAIKNKKLVKINWCGLEECEDWIKDKSGGAKSISIPFDQPEKISGRCPHCDKPAKLIAYFAKSY